MKWLIGVYVSFLGVIIFLASQEQYQPLFRTIKTVPYSDKLGHFLLMGLLAFIVNLALSGAVVKVGRFYLLKGSLIVSLVVTLEEISQLFVQHRTFDLLDLAFDFLGIFCLGRLAYYLTRRSQNA